ncbi:DUF6506 family protein [Pseudonocardia sp. NPDC046786]|uniref:DUF6506 family protein n=1 Tax=Pseudonocardia sp. NPDC046786 TaxID=3155471 RepID=UPI0033DA6133
MSADASVRWAYLFEHPGAAPERDRMVLDSGGVRSLLVAVPGTDAAPAVAAALVRDEGVGLIELCGGFGSADVAAVTAAVEGAASGVAVGHVVFGVDQVLAAAAYAAAASATP